MKVEITNFRYLKFLKTSTGFGFLKKIKNQRTVCFRYFKNLKKEPNFMKELAKLMVIYIYMEIKIFI